LRLNPNHADVYFNLSVARQALGDSDGQIKAIRKALGINPRYAKAVLHEGIWIYEQGDFVRGMARIKEAIGLDEGLNTERYRFALECHEKGQKARALANLMVLESADASDANAHAKTGNEFAKQGLWLEAAQEYERGIRFAPRYADLRCRYGAALRELGRSDDAIEQLRIALEINPNYADAHAEIGMVYRQLGNDLLAKAAFERALTINPYHIVARQHATLNSSDGHAA
ncbi:MAG: tetratricopeptide repeat protein, partial [Chthonomonas sp.]|nr:tetratricopeptide repeat protein [Chthonomonas sp.]